MPRVRDNSPVRWKESKPVPLVYDHMKWHEIVENLIDHPESFHGGFPVGYIQIEHRNDKIFGFRFKYKSQHLQKGHCTEYFGVNDFGGDRAQTRRAVEEFQLQFSKENHLMTNQYRMITENTVEMILTKGKTTIFDLGYLDQLKQHPWSTNTCKGKYTTEKYYAKGGGVAQPMATVIFGHNENGDRIDHVNGNTLDNRRVNLVSATARSNANNLSLYVNNTSGVAGVTNPITPTHRYWMSYWQENGRRISGPRHRYFENIEGSAQQAFEAACYDRKVADARTGCKNGRRPKRIIPTIE